MQDLLDTLLEVYEKEQEIKADRETPSAPVTGCCADPQVRGGKCENCDEWFEDFHVEQDRRAADLRADRASAAFGYSPGLNESLDRAEPWTAGYPVRSDIGAPR